jgi:hypothetical protein
MRNLKPFTLMHGDGVDVYSADGRRVECYLKIVAERGF